MRCGIGLVVCYERLDFRHTRLVCRAIGNWMTALVRPQKLRDLVFELSILLLESQIQKVRNQFLARVLARYVHDGGLQEQERVSEASCHVLSSMKGPKRGLLAEDSFDSVCSQCAPEVLSTGAFHEPSQFLAVFFEADSGWLIFSGNLRSIRREEVHRRATMGSVSFKRRV